jgi:hypothetical protein
MCTADEGGGQGGDKSLTYVCETVEQVYSMYRTDCTRVYITQPPQTPIISKRPVVSLSDSL